MASGDTMVTGQPNGGEPLATGTAATLELHNGASVLAFDGGIEEIISFRCTLPRHYAGGGLTVTTRWMSASATSGDIKIGTSIERRANNDHDLDADAFATEQTGTATANGTSGKVFEVTTTHTSGANMDSLAAGEDFRFKIARKAADGADTMAGDAHLDGFEIKET